VYTKLKESRGSVFKARKAKKTGSPSPCGASHPKHSGTFKKKLKSYKKVLNN
jgi:hypothetical protein